MKSNCLKTKEIPRFFWEDESARWRLDSRLAIEREDALYYKQREIDKLKAELQNSKKAYEALSDLHFHSSLDNPNKKSKSSDDFESQEELEDFDRDSTKQFLTTVIITAIAIVVLILLHFIY